MIKKIGYSAISSLSTLLANDNYTVIATTNLERQPVRLANTLILEALSVNRYLACLA
jgi:hypothetical protein